MRRTTFAVVAAVLAGLSLASSAKAEIVTRAFELGTVGIAYTYGSFGYTPEGGEYTVLTDYSIVSTHVKIDYRPDPGVDREALVIAMVVPTVGATSEYLRIEGGGLVESSTEPGLYQLEFTSTDYNGVIRAGRYSIETYTMDSEGNPTGTPGTLEGSALTFSVAIPEPMAGAVLAPAAMLLSRRRR